MTIDHQRCSELLPAHVRGELPEPDAEAVREHIAGCAACGREEQGLKALLSVESGPLTEMERTRLHRRLEDAIAAEAGPVVEEVERMPWSGRLARLAWAAAAVLLVVAGFAYIGSQVGGGAGDAETAGAPQEAVRGGEGEAGKGGEAATGEALDATGGAQRPSPRFVRNSEKLTERRLRATGSSRVPIVRYAPAYTTEDVNELQEDFVDRLVSQAPESLRDQVRACTAVVIEGAPRSLVAYGRVAEVEGRDALVMSFAWTDEDSGPLDQFMVWAWPLGGSCDTPVAYRFGHIKPGA